MEPTTDLNEYERRAFEHIFHRPPDGWMYSDARETVRLLAVEMERDDLRAEVERLKTLGNRLASAAGRYLSESMPGERDVLPSPALVDFAGQQLVTAIHGWNQEVRPIGVG